MSYLVPNNPMFDRTDQIHRRLPTIRLEQHFFYSLQQQNATSTTTPVENRTIKSSRRLRSLCLRKLIVNERYLNSCLQQQQILSSTPSNIFYSLAQEAIFMNEYQILEILIACWPLRRLEIVRLLPLASMLLHLHHQGQEEEIETIAKLLERKLSDGSTLLDYIVMGLVNKQTNLSQLKIVDFHGCSTSPQLTKELYRLPLLWIAPERRGLLNKRMYVEKSKLEKYIEGFNYVYQYYDKSIAHERTFAEPVQILLDCQMINEDTLIALELQNITPFRFHFRKLWINHSMRQILPPSSLFDLNLILNLTQSDNITHLHLSDSQMETSENELQLLVRSLANLRNLRVLCLQRVLNFYPQRYTTPQMLTNFCSDFNRVFRRLIYLRKLDLSYSYLQSYIPLLFSGLVQPLEYLSLQDCRLVSSDLEFLHSMRNLRYVKELNLSMNNFCSRSCFISLGRILSRCSQLTILSFSYCSLSASNLLQLADDFVEDSSINILSLKSIIPYYSHEFDLLLEKFGQMKTLKKLSLFPPLYAYPGANDDEREMVAEELFRRCCQKLQSLNRQDLELS